MTDFRQHAGSQRGVALIAAMLFLMVISFIGLSSMRSSTMQQRMAGAEQAKTTAFETAVSAVDATLSNPNNTPVIGNAVFSACTSNVTIVNCTNNIQFPTGAFQDVNVNDVYAIAQRTSPDEENPPAWVQTSADKFAAAQFRLQTRYEGLSAGQGQSSVVQGLMVLIPKN